MAGRCCLELLQASSLVLDLRLMDLRFVDPVQHPCLFPQITTSLSIPERFFSKWVLHSNLSTLEIASLSLDRSRGKVDLAASDPLQTTVHYAVYLTALQFSLPFTIQCTYYPSPYLSHHWRLPAAARRKAGS